MGGCGGGSRVTVSPTVQAPRYEPPPPLEAGKLYAVGDTRKYLESAVFPWLSAALDELRCGATTTWTTSTTRHDSPNHLGL